MQTGSVSNTNANAVASQTELQQASLQNQWDAQSVAATSSAAPQSSDVQPLDATSTAMPVGQPDMTIDGVAILMGGLDAAGLNPENLIRNQIESTIEGFYQLKLSEGLNEAEAKQWSNLLREQLEVVMPQGLAENIPRFAAMIEKVMDPGFAQLQAELLDPSSGTTLDPNDYASQELFAVIGDKSGAEALARIGKAFLESVVLGVDGTNAGVALARSAYPAAELSADWAAGAVQTNIVGDLQAKVLEMDTANGIPEARIAQRQETFVFRINRLIDKGIIGDVVVSADMNGMPTASAATSPTATAGDIVPEGRNYSDQQIAEQLMAVPPEILMSLIPTDQASMDELMSVSGMTEQDVFAMTQIIQSGMGAGPVGQTPAASDAAAGPAGTAVQSQEMDPTQQAMPPSNNNAAPAERNLTDGELVQIAGTILPEYRSQLSTLDPQTKAQFFAETGMNEADFAILVGFFGNPLAEAVFTPPVPEVNPLPSYSDDPYEVGIEMAQYS